MQMDDEPDFRHMTPDQIREGIAALNKVIKRLQQFRTENGRKLGNRAIGGAVVTFVTAAIIPPAAPFVWVGSAALQMGPLTGYGISGAMIEDVKSLRDKFKEVWRARPGRKFHDVAARAAREKARKKANRKFHFPGFG